MHVLPISMTTGLLPVTTMARAVFSNHTPRCQRPELETMCRGFRQVGRKCLTNCHNLIKAQRGTTGDRDNGKEDVAIVLVTAPALSNADPTHNDPGG